MLITNFTHPLCWGYSLPMPYLILYSGSVSPCPRYFLTILIPSMTYSGVVSPWCSRAAGHRRRRRGRGSPAPSSGKGPCRSDPGTSLLADCGQRRPRATTCSPHSRWRPTRHCYSSNSGAVAASSSDRIRCLPGRHLYRHITASAKSATQWRFKGVAPCETCGPLVTLWYWLQGSKVT